MEKITRREFFKIGATAVLTAVAPKIILAAEPDEIKKPVIGVATGKQENWSRPRSTRSAGSGISSRKATRF
jgi:hypothetical protein